MARDTSGAKGSALSRCGSRRKPPISRELRRRGCKGLKGGEKTTRERKRRARNKDTIAEEFLLLRRDDIIDDCVHANRRCSLGGDLPTAACLDVYGPAVSLTSRTIVAKARETVTSKTRNGTTRRNRDPTTEGSPSRGGGRRNCISRALFDARSIQ